MDKKNKKHILRWLAASMCAFTVTSLTGCAEEVSNLFGGNRGEVEVTASFNEPGKAVTRAHDGLNSTSGFTLTTAAESQSKVRVMVDQNDGTYSEYDYDITGATTINRDSKPTFPSGESSVNVYGWYPAKSLTNFTVAADQKGNTGYCLSDLMFANGTTCVRNISTGTVTSAANLEFSHVMAKVKVNLTLATGVTVKSATFKTMKNKVTVTETKPANAVTGYSATTDDVSTSDITLLTDGSLTNASDAADLKLCGVFPDQEKNGAFLVITANYNGGADQTITYSFASAKHFVKGNEYTMNISLDGTNVTTTTVDITAWNVESGIVNIGGGGGGSLALDNTSASLTFGSSNGTVTVTETGTVTNITASSANTGIATASASGTTVTISPVAAGTTQVLVYGVKDGNMLSSVVTVNVAKAAASFSLSSSALTISGLNTTNTFTVTRPGTGNDGTISCEVVNGTGEASVSDINQSTGVVTVTGTTEGTATVKVSVGAGTNYEASTSTQDVAVTIIADPGVALTSASAVVGMIVASNGKAYTTSNYSSSYGSKVAVIGYRSGSNGYAVALVDAAQDTWNSITNSGANKNVDCMLADGKRGSVPAAPTGTTWKVLNKANYTAMWQAMGSADTYNATSNKLITDAGGTALSGPYWSSQEYGDDLIGWGFYSNGWDTYDKDNSYNVRPVLAW